MDAQTTVNEQVPQSDLFIKMIVDHWNTVNGRFNRLVDSLSDEQIMSQVAPGRNRGIYLLGHLVAVHDAMLPILGLGEKIHPELADVFHNNPDDPTAQMPSISELKQYRDEINAALSNGMAQIEPSEWFSRHTAVSVDDFAKEPQRNKLNIIVNRSNHLSYHLGQLAFLAKKAGQS